MEPHPPCPPDCCDRLFVQCLVCEDSQPSPYPSPAPSLNHASLSVDRSQAQVTFENGPLTLTTEHTWSWTQPPQGLLQWNTSEPSILAPLPLQPKELTPSAPSPPLNASALANTQLGNFFEVPGLIHVLKTVHLQAWDCSKACKLLDSKAPTTRVYTDGSAAPLCYGSAATLFPTTGPPRILCCSSPYESSEGSEYWAFRIALQWLHAFIQHNRVCFLNDNDQVQRTLACAVRHCGNDGPVPPEASLLTRLYCSVLGGLPEQCIVQSPWIKGHAGFAGNEVSDYFSKWAAHGLSWHRKPTPPPSRFGDAQQTPGPLSSLLLLREVTSARTYPL